MAIRNSLDITTTEQIVDQLGLPPTADERLAALRAAAVIALVGFAFAKGFLYFRSRGNRAKHTRGGPICWWMPLGYFVGFAWGVWIADNKSYYLGEVTGGLGGFGLLIGLAIGWIHGSLNLNHNQRSELVGGALEQPLVKQTEDGNPYRSPMSE